MEIYRSRDGRWVIERAIDRYLIYDTERSDEDEVWSTSTMEQLLTWLHRNGLSVADFDEI